MCHVPFSMLRYELPRCLLKHPTAHCKPWCTNQAGQYMGTTPVTLCTMHLLITASRRLQGVPLPQHTCAQRRHTIQRATVADADSCEYPESH